MSNYTRIFLNRRYQQIVVMRRQDKDGGPEVRIYFQPEGMGVCEFGIGFRDDVPGDAAERLDRAFVGLNGQAAVELVDGYMANMAAKSKGLN